MSRIAKLSILNFLCTLGILFLSCASPSHDHSVGLPDSTDIPTHIDSAFLDSVSHFETNVSVKVNIGLVFADLNDSKIGICHQYADGKSYVVISKSFWEKSSTNNRLWVIYHELGHCVLNKSHNESTVVIDSVVRPVSFMTKNKPNNNNVDYIFNNLATYVSEFKN